VQISLTFTAGDLIAAVDQAAVLSVTEIHLDADAEGRVTGCPAGTLAAELTADPFPTLLPVTRILEDAGPVDAGFRTRVAESARSAAAVGPTGLVVTAVEAAGTTLAFLRAAAKSAVASAAIVATLQSLACRRAAVGLVTGCPRRAFAVRLTALAVLAEGIVTKAVSAAIIAILRTGQAVLPLPFIT